MSVVDRLRCERGRIVAAAQQRWLLMADGRNNQVVTLLRETGAVVAQRFTRLP